ncbi:unnamed protein product [Cylicocyclus nassatus]|uniref:Uncharacterized protein n=1 Tax=Cylicocyclus nassatus TaxID=53992 RepID=A0AA36GVH4_CYLNA|nr:unnamed protein product [Cylicocyclus nassatus]
MSYQQFYDSLNYAILALSNVVMTALTINAFILCTSKQKKLNCADRDMKYQPRAVAGSPKTSEEVVKVQGSKISVSGSLDKTTAQIGKDDFKIASKDDSFERIQPRVAMAKRYQEIANLHVERRRKDYDTLEGCTGIGIGPLS